ncbi:MAG: hypothetical protein K8I60_10890 [Anaerolineae bacterium]|nr:hypothetical protein [Anaerolineae bacterium]
MTTYKDTLQPEYLIESYRRAHEMVHHTPAHVTCISHDWYQINGEIVHRGTILAQTAQLSALAQQEHLHTHEKKQLIYELIQGVAAI